MLLRRAGDAVVAIGQPAHAWISGQLARAWGNERFGRIEPREEVCLAAEQHDVGMAEWEAAPTLNRDTGLPHSFLEMPLETHVELWSHAWQLVLPQSRYAALLVSMHGAALYRMRDPSKLDERQAALVRTYLAEQTAVQERLRVPGDAHVERNQRLIWAWDAFSLALCLDWAPHTLRAVPAAAGEVDVELTPAGGCAVRVDPWPFSSDRLTVRCDGRRLEGRFDVEDEMRAALAAAPWTALDFELVA
ncbi:MAG: hypothetical protein QOH38_1285 [Thermoleophilaceae bacterium]|nr:hypothetical protein [Thermoleophilaceae bacterium]